MQNHAPGPDTGQREKAVFRNLAIPVSAFDHIKDTQRALQASTGQAVTLNQAVAHIVHQHRQQNAAQGGHGRVSAILRPL
jgi:hypothetical protein